MATFSIFFCLQIEEPEARSVFGQSLQTYVSKTIVPRRPPPSVRRAMDTTDYGEYEDEYSCSPPAVCMIIVSILEVRSMVDGVDLWFCDTLKIVRFTLICHLSILRSLHFCMM